MDFPNLKGKWFGFILFLPVITYRLIAWLLVIIVLADMSCIVIIVVLVLNLALLLFYQKEEITYEPISQSIISLVFPNFKINNKSQNTERHILTWQILLGNMVLMVSLTTIFVLCSLNIYNPWDTNVRRKILLSPDLLEIIYWSLVSLFLAASLPTFLLFHLPSKR